MGVCASSQNTIKRRRRRSSSSPPPTHQAADHRGNINLRPPSSGSCSIIVIHVDGKVQELKQPTQAKQVISQNPSCFLCSSESMSVGTLVPSVPEEEYLQQGQIYFLLPQSQAKHPLSLPDLCHLAIKASSALGKGDVDFSNTCNSKFNLGWWRWSGVLPSSLGTWERRRLTSLPVWPMVFFTKLFFFFWVGVFSFF